MRISSETQNILGIFYLEVEKESLVFYPLAGWHETNQLINKFPTRIKPKTINTISNQETITF